MAPISYFKAYLAFLPCQRLLSMTPVSLNSSRVPRAITWALICSCKPSHDLPTLMAQPKGAPMLICDCNINAAYLGIFLFVGLGLGVSCWLVLGVAC